MMLRTVAFVVLLLQERESAAFRRFEGFRFHRFSASMYPHRSNTGMRRQLEEPSIDATDPFNSLKLL